MTRDEACAAWKDVWAELSARLADVRPKLKDYEAHMILNKARNAVLSVYEEAKDIGVLRAAALSAFVGLPYMKTSPYYVQAVQPHEALATLKAAADAAGEAFDAACKPHYVDGRWGAYRAIECNQAVPPAVTAALDAYHAAAHEFYAARDGEKGFLGSRGA